MLYSPNGLSPSLDFPFITTPENYSHLLTKQKCALFFQSLLSLLIKNQNNPSLLLNYHSANNDFFTEILKIIINDSSKENNRLLIGILNVLIKNWCPKKNHYEIIYKSITDFTNNNNIEGIQRCLKVLCIFAQEKESALNYFFFSPLSSGLLINGSLKWEFNEGYSFVLWIKLEDMQILKKYYGTIKPILVNIKSESQIIYYFCGSKLCYEGIELVTLLTNTWYCIGISHNAEDKLLVMVNSELKEFSVVYPKNKTGMLIEDIKVCENFAGQLNSFILYKKALSKKDLVKMKAKFSEGITIQNYRRALSQDDIHSAFAPFNYISHNTIKDLNKEQYTARLIGNSGIVRLPIPLFGPYQEITLEKLLITLKVCKDSEQLFYKLLKTIKSFVNYLAKYEKDTIRVKNGYKVTCEMLKLHMIEFIPDIGTERVFKVFEELASVKVLGEYIIEVLWETRLYWINTPIAQHYWQFLSSKIESVLKERDILRELLVTMREIDKDGSGFCCQQGIDEINRKSNIIIIKHYSLNETYKYITDFLDQAINNFTKEDTKTIICTLIKASSHCLFLTLLGLLDNNDKVDELNAYKKIMQTASSFSLETQIECFKVLKKTMNNSKTYNTSIGDLYKFLYKSFLQNLNAQEAERLITVEREQTEEENNTSLLQEKVLSEQESINSTIKKIKQIKIDIQESTQPNKEFLEEELIAKDPYKPPPAPKNEKMKRFFFGERDQSEPIKLIPEVPKVEEEKLVVPKLQLVKTTSKQSKPEADKKPKFNKLLMIDTDKINEEFDIGGEKGKKLVDEEEEEAKFEQEIQELAEHCLRAMNRNSPSDQLIEQPTLGRPPIEFPQSTKERKQFTFSLEQTDTPIKEESLMTSKSSLGRNTICLGSEQSVSESFCEFMVSELMGKECSKGDLEKVLKECEGGEVRNPSAARIIIKLVGKIEGYQIALIEFLMKLSDESLMIIGSDNKVMKELFNTEYDLYNLLSDASSKTNTVVEFEHMIKLHSKLIDKCTNSMQSIIRLKDNLLKYIVNSYKKPQSIYDCIKYVWGKTLSYINNKSYTNTKPWIVYLSEITLGMLLFDKDEDNDRVSLVVLYSDKELFKLLFEIMGREMWKANGVFLDHLEILKEQHLVMHEPNTKLNPLVSIGVLMNLAFKNAKENLELEYWIAETEQIVKYLLLVLEGKDDYDLLLSEAIALIIGNLLNEFVHSEANKSLYAQSLGRIFLFVFECIKSSGSKVKAFYESQLVTNESKCLVPVEEINVMENIAAQDLTRILTPEYNQLHIQHINTKQLIKDLQTIYEKVNTKITVEDWKVDINLELKSLIKLESMIKKWRRIQNYYNTSINYVLSAHQSESEVHCLIKKKNNDYVMDSRIIKIIKENPDYVNEIAEMLIKDLPEKIRKKLLPPMFVEASFNFKTCKGVLLIYKKHYPSLLLIKQNTSKSIFKKWKLYDMKRLYRKDNNRLEILFYGGKSLLITNNSSEERNLLASKLVRLRGKYCTWLKYTGTLDPLKEFTNTKLTDKWLTNKISALDYLLAINTCSGNSFNDVNKYPSLPYLISEANIMQITKDIYSLFENYNAEPTHSMSNLAPEAYFVPFVMLKGNNKDTTDHYKQIVEARQALEDTSKEFIVSWIKKHFPNFFDVIPTLRHIKHPLNVLDSIVLPKLTLINQKIPDVILIQDITPHEWLIITSKGTIYSISKTSSQKISILTQYKPYLTNPIYFLSTQQYLAQGGFISGIIQLTPMQNNKHPNISLHYHLSSVTALAIDKEERLAITGTKEGQCLIFSLCKDMFWNPKAILSDHETDITSISIAEDTQVFVSSSNDGLINLYRLCYKPRIVRSFKVSANVHSVLIANNPLPCLIACCKDRIYTFSLYGEILAEAIDETASPVIGRDSKFRNHLVYAVKQELIVRSLPYLERRVLIKADKEIVKLEVSENVILILEDGSIIYISA